MNLSGKLPKNKQINSAPVIHICICICWECIYVLNYRPDYLIVELFSRLKRHRIVSHFNPFHNVWE